MKTSFLPRLVNGQTGDPALFVDLLRYKRALLFDCGTLTALSPSEILRVTDLFVSHAHIDHFIGFEHLLRLHLGRGRRVRVFGPKGITDCVRGKLSGYTWNLVRRQRLVFEAIEFDGEKQLATEFHCRQKFRKGETRKLPGSDILLEDELVTVRTAILDHRIPSLAFAVNERDFYNIDPVKLKACGLEPGPWLNDLKDWVRRGRTPGKTIEVADHSRDPAELADQLLVVSPGRTLAYVADTLGSKKSIDKIVRLAHEADILFCEGAFLHEDKARASETYHLTAQQAGQIARSASVKRLVVFHFSPKYEGRFAELDEEAQQAFTNSTNNETD